MSGASRALTAVTWLSRVLLMVSLWVLSELGGHPLGAVIWIGGGHQVLVNCEAWVNRLCVSSLPH